jgi:FKBP-type peptidyl-prolyl cis-trans isomerase
MNKTGTSVAIIIGAVIIFISLLLYARLHQAGQEEQPLTSNISLDGQSTDTKPATNDTQTTTKPSTKPMTTNGLQITTVAEGAGEQAKSGDTVSVHYTGMLTNGTVFDSNVDPKFGHPEPFSFTLGQNRVIAGWEQGVLGMKKGEKRHLVIPSDLAYGDRGAGALIPPNATLEFDVELLAINGK